MKHIEDNEQITLMEWAQLQSCKFPELSLLFHIPNGGKRNEIEAARFKKMGVKAGVPDLFLPVAHGNFHGLFIEMKAPKGKPTVIQKEWHKHLKAGGYAVEICYGFEEAAKVLIAYLNLK